MPTRPLTREEIHQLESQDCRAENWDWIRVSTAFSADHIFNVSFRGRNQIGSITGNLSLNNDLTRPAGLENCCLESCTVGDRVRIANVRELIGYHVQTGAVLEDIGSCVIVGATTFGNGTEIDVLNEGGGRPLILSNRLNAQIAYMMVLYRHDPEITEQLVSLINKDVMTQKSTTGEIGTGAHVHHVVSLKNVWVGPHAHIEGARDLTECSFMSTKADPIRIGFGVSAERVVVLSGSHIESGVLLSDCFIGQGVRLGRQFSAEHSAFFANCEAYHGEALGVFAGPYTVTHHKSSLLIAALYSFYNAGSGTNQSNHMYKLGPLHQGILERGVKTGSGSYLLWPCRVGAFTAVIGKHESHFDTQDLPFSYISREGERSVLTPAMNLVTVGTKRDSEKWPKRDRRQDTQIFDLISFDLFSPYIIGRVVRGMKVLDQLGKQQTKREYVKYRGIDIKRLLLKMTRRYYQMAIDVFIGQQLLQQSSRLSGTKSAAALREKMKPQSTASQGEWVDMAGLIAPKTKIDNAIDDIRTGAMFSLQDVNSRLREIHENYSIDAWNWCVKLLESQTGDPINRISSHSLTERIDAFRDQQTKLNNMILKDAAKEFDANSQTGYGIDGREDIKAKDFVSVRGHYHENSFVQQLKEENAETEKMAHQLKTLFKSL